MIERLPVGSGRKAASIALVVGLTLPAIVGLLQSPMRTPWVAWGQNERDVVYYLRSVVDDGGSYVVFTPEYTLPYAYNVKHVEMRESLIAEILLKADSIENLRHLLAEEYPEADTFYVVLTNISRDIISERYPILTMFEPSEAVFIRPTAWLFVLTPPQTSP